MKSIRLPRDMSLLVVFFMFILNMPAPAQNLIGAYTTSSPEAALFFLNPDYMNPAQGGGVMGIGCNPASLTGVQGRMASINYGFAQSSSGTFNIKAGDSTAVYSPVYLDAKIKLHEMAGLAGIGFGQQLGRWRWGLAVMQPRRAGIRLQAQGSVNLDAHFFLDQPITPAIDPSMPVPQLPVNWEVQSRITLTLSGAPTELYLATLPVTAAFAYKTGPLSLGAGLTWQYIYSSSATAELNSHISGKAVAIGAPYGVNPITQQPWSGVINATVSVEDNPAKAIYKIDATGSRLGLSCGAKLDIGPLALGAAYAYAFRGNITGEYKVFTVRTIDIPANVLFSNVKLNWSTSPVVNGTVDFGIADFKKDTLTYHAKGRLSMAGVHSYSAGLRLLFLGLFAGGEIPERAPDLTSFWFGVYLHTPLPKLPIRINVGFINRTDGIRSEQELITPYRVVSHVGMGVAVRLPVNRWLHINDRENWLRIGIRSSIASWMLESFEDKGEPTLTNSLPSMSENLSVCLGLDMPL